MRRVLRLGLLIAIVMCFACRPGPASDDQLSERQKAGHNKRSEAELKAPVPILFWNLENYFDAIDDPHGHDNDRKDWWDQQLYDFKTDNLVEILTPFARQRAIMTFAELEHKAVLENLRKRLPAADSYHIVYHNIRYARIKQGALSPYPVLRSNALQTLRGQRPIIEMELNVHGESIIVFINHWKSRRGGLEETDPKRMAAARALYKRIAKLRKRDPLVSIVVLGDFNDEPEDASLRRGLRSHPEKAVVQRDPSRLWNCLENDDQGSASFRGRWQLLDQILISPGLLDNKGLQVKSCETYDAGGDLVRRGRPWRFGDRGVPNQYRGYSDHLPVVVYLK